MIIIIIIIFFLIHPLPFEIPSPFYQIQPEIALNYYFFSCCWITLLTLSLFSMACTAVFPVLAIPLIKFFFHLFQLVCWLNVVDFSNFLIGIFFFFFFFFFY
ncbi:hypothetical protein U3516DRAFT_114800 [Neocallimastix sp. 'constans']